MWWTKYRSIPQTTADEKISSHEVQRPYDEHDYSQPTQLRTILILGTQIILLVVSAIFFASGLVLRSSNPPVDRSQGGRSTIGSLVNEYHPQRFEIEYIHTPYRGPPSWEVDRAWEELVENKYMIIPDEDLHGVNTSSHEPLRGSNDKDTGVWAMFEGFHALHCVNLLWRQTWPDYYVRDQEKLRAHPEPTHIHLDHCADLLRQMIQCNMDFSIITHYRKGTKVFADYDVLHQCQNFDAALQYTKDHQWSKKYQHKFDGFDENQKALWAEHHDITSVL